MKSPFKFVPAGFATKTYLKCPSIIRIYKQTILKAHEHLQENKPADHTDIRRKTSQKICGNLRVFAGKQTHQSYKYA